MSNLTLVKTIFLKAPPEHVWRFLTEADQLATWFHKGGADLVEGGDYQLLTNSYGKDGDKLCWGKVIEMKKPHRLVHTFTHDHLAGLETTCTWTLERADGGTVLTLTHEGFDKVKENPFNMAADHDKGWDQHFVRLRQVAA